jgi:hypothetical protein
MWASMEDRFFDCVQWQVMPGGLELPVAKAAIGLLHRDDFAARRGTLLLWRHTADGCRADLREYSGVAGDDVAVLLVADSETLTALREGGWVLLPTLVRQGRLHPYMLKTMDALQEAGLADFVEALGLVFPRH